ncbi:MAG: hypothetical protein PVF68_16710 [Acidobacteriota bacterium]|jgi:hypothetical protein
MSRDPRDPKGYYATLNLSPEASDAEVRLAYTFLKSAWRTNRKLDRRKIKQAFDVLSDAELRAAYRRSTTRRPAISPDRQIYVLGGSSAAVLFLIAAFLFPGFLRPAPEPFSPGDRLLNQRTMAPLGEVLRREAGHVFPNGGTGDAYLIRLEDGQERWFPIGDLEEHYRTD